MSPDSVEMEKKIRNVIRTKVRPILLEDGGNIEFVSYDSEEGVVNVKLAGSCLGCPLAALTLRNVVADSLKLHLPDLGEIKVSSADVQPEDLQF